jgi:hypothetical protein
MGTLTHGNNNIYSTLLPSVSRVKHNGNASLYKACSLLSLDFTIVSQDMMVWKPSKLHKIEDLNLFDVELCLAVHKFFVSTSLNIIHPGCTFHLSYSYWAVTSLYENTMSSITVTLHKLT